MMRSTCRPGTGTGQLELELELEGPGAPCHARCCQWSRHHLQAPVLKPGSAQSGPVRLLIAPGSRDRDRLHRVDLI
eukprot:2427205-Rhodomonas_salina.1